MDELRASVRKSFPEVREIQDRKLGDLVVEAWAFALSESEFNSVEEIPATGVPTSPRLKQGTQTEHIRGVTRMALAMAVELEKVLGPLGVNHDLLIAEALCHDVGKPFEYSPRNQKRWRENPAYAGNPAIRHPVYGVHVCLSVGLPEPVVHAAGAHSAEGNNVQRSLENTLVHFADEAFWHAAERAGFLTTEP